MSTFTAADYAVMSDEMRDSANAAAPVLLQWLRDYGRHGWEPRRIIDVGCGPGWWSARLAQCGAAVTGVDGPEGGEALHATGRGRYVTADITEAGWLEALAYDVAVCLEVAEHLSPAAGTALVRGLMAAAPVVVFSAAIPGQGGVGHINEQWQHHWARMFDGWETTAAIRDELWHLEGVAPYYPQNMFVAFDHRALDPPVRAVDPVVHPGVWAHVNARRGARWR